MLRRLIPIVLLVFGFIPATAEAQTPPSASEQYRQVLRLMTAGKYEESLAAARRLIERSDEHERVFYRVIEAARSWGRLDEARVLFESLLQANPPNYRAYYGLGLYYAAKNDYKAAVESHQRCLKELPEYFLPIFPMINGYRALNKDAEAESYVRSLLAANPNSATARLGLGYYHYWNRRPDEAAREMEAAQLLNPRMVEACYYRGQAFSFIERYRDALDALKKCLPPLESAAPGLNDEDRKRFSLQLGLLYAPLGIYNEAVKHIEESLQIAREISDRAGEEIALGFLGQVYIRMDDLTRAAAAINQAMEIAQQDDRPDSVSNHLSNLATIYEMLGDLPKALDHYEQALRKTRDLDSQLSTLSSLGGLFVAHREPDRAVDYFKRLVKLEQTSATRRPRMIVDEAAAFIHANAGEYPKAIESLAQAAITARKGGNVEQELRATNGLGDLHLRAGNHQRAAEAFNGALQLALDRSSPHHAWRAYHGLARTFELRNEFEKAAEFYRRAVEMMESVRGKLTAGEERAFFFQDKVETYRRLYGVLMRLSRDAKAKGDSTTAHRHAAEAFHASERARARAMLDRLGTAAAGNLDREVEADLKAERWEIQARFAQAEAQHRQAASDKTTDAVKLKLLEDELKKAAEAMSDWQRRVRLRNPHLAGLRYPEPLTAEQVQQVLKPQSIDHESGSRKSGNTKSIKPTKGTKGSP